MEKKPSVPVRLMQIARQGKGFLTLSCISTTIGTLAGLVPFISVYFIARELLMPSGPGLEGALMTWIAVAAMGIVANMVFSYLGSYGAHKTAFRILYGFRIRVMEHIGRLPFGFLTEHTSGDVQKTMDENIERIEGFVAHLLPDIIGSAAALIALFLGLFLINGYLALTVVAAIIAAIALQFTMFIGKKGKMLWAELAAASRDMTGAFSEFVNGMAEVKLFGLTGTVTRGLNENIKRINTWELRQYKKSGPSFAAYKVIILSLLAFVLPVGLLMISHNPGDADVLMGVLMALIITPAIYDPLLTLVNYGAQMGQIGAGLDAIDVILDAEPIPRPLHPKLPRTYDVALKDVSFSYQDAADPMRAMALTNLSFVARQGQMTALVGPSGGGKSTVAQLIARFWDVESGGIEIGGMDIREIEPEKLTELVSIVLQDTFIFTDNALDNITMHGSYTLDQVRHAAREAQIDELIMSLPQGYQTRLGEGGARLSGGEAQRLAIARAILRDAPIVVLDEALAYSDAENENLIQRAIKRLIEHKTVIVIAHRLQSIRGADQILVLSDGKLIERGNHAELMGKNCEYRELWQLQHQADAWAIGGEEARA